MAPDGGINRGKEFETGKAAQMIWTIEDYTKKTQGFLRIFRRGEPVADVFPFAASRDAARVREDAMWLLEAANAFEPDDHVAELEPSD